jgi:hypothetical protein
MTKRKLILLPVYVFVCLTLVSCDIDVTSGILEAKSPNVDVTGTWTGQASCTRSGSGQRFEYGITINLQQNGTSLAGSVEMPPCLQPMPITEGSIFRGGICSDSMNDINFTAEGLGRSFETTGWCAGLNQQQPNGPLALPFRMVTNVAGCPGGSGAFDFDAP